MSGGSPLGRGTPGDSMHFVLMGVMMNLFLAAVITFVTAMSGAPGLRDASFWTMGGLGGTLWPYVSIAAPVTVGATGMICLVGSRLNLLALGETEARHLGVDTGALRWQVIIIVAVLTGTVVAFAGSIAFVGLVVPHVLRLLIGPDHRLLIPASALGGAVMVGGADVFARTLVAPMELPIGILTTLVGGPLFFYLLHRMRKQGGWR